MLKACPEGHQSENWLLDPNKRWVKVGEASWDDLPQLECRSGPLWINVGASTRGLYNRIQVARIGEIIDSLRLIHVSDLTVRVSLNYYRTGMDVDGKFMFDGTAYRLSVTDPIVEEEYKARPIGDYDLGERYLTVSLGEAYQDYYHYKLIAGVIAKDG